MLGQHNTYTTNGATGAQTVMNVFVQVGRGIVYIDPITDEHDSKDPASMIESAVSAATTNLAEALGVDPKP